MAMEIVQMVNGAHEDSLSAIAYDRVKREVHTAAEGDKAIKVWDLKTGQLLRTQTAHKGMVTCLAYASSAKLLFLGSMDSSIGVWTEKGSLLQETLSSRQLSNNQQLFAMQLGHSRATPGHTQVHGTLD